MQPRIAGLPFLTFWLFVGVIVTPVVVWLSSLGDPVRRRNWKQGQR